METETKTTAPEVTLRASTFPGLFIIGTPRGHITVSREVLEGIVQAAYDVAGLVATPSVEVEAAAWAERHRAQVEAERLRRAVPL